MKNFLIICLLAAVFSGCGSSEKQPASPDPDNTAPAENAEKVIYQRATMYAAATDFYFTNEQGEEVEVRVANLPEERTTVYPENLLEDIEGLEGPPGANPEMVGKSFLLIKNEKGEVTEIRYAGSSQ